MTKQLSVWEVVRKDAESLGSRAMTQISASGIAVAQRGNMGRKRTDHPAGCGLLAEAHRDGRQLE